jgi:hypothetical protein
LAGCVRRLAVAGVGRAVEGIDREARLQVFTALE